MRICQTPIYQMQTYHMLHCINQPCSYATLYKANMSWANQTDTNLTYAVLRKANLMLFGAVMLFGAAFYKANFSTTKISFACFSRDRRGNLSGRTFAGLICRENLHRKKPYPICNSYVKQCSHSQGDVVLNI